MRRPTCDCIKENIDMMERSIEVEFKYERKWQSTFLDLNCCPECGKPYQEVDNE